MFEEDLTLFFEKDELADEIVIRKSGEIIVGMIENDYVDIDSISGSNPVLVCATSDLYGLRRGDIIEHGSIAYVFIKDEPDGTGVSRAILEQ